MRLINAALLAFLLSGICVSGADVSDLTYSSNGSYITITDCNALASGVLDIPNRIDQLPVRFIGDRSFLQCSRLVAITVPEGVTGIGNYTFYGCSSLVEITLPESLTEIGLTAFRGCSSLTGITIPEGVTSIRHYAFYGCSSLTAITIPKGVTSIGNFAFFGCSNLGSINFLGDAPSLGNDAFSGLPDGAMVVITTGAFGFGDFFGGVEVVAGETHTAQRLKFRVGLTDADQVAISFSAVAGRNYSIEGSPDMRDWERLDSGIAGAGDYVLRVFPASSRKRFFRVLESSAGK